MEKKLKNGEYMQIRFNNFISTIKDRIYPDNQATVSSQTTTDRLPIVNLENANVSNSVVISINSDQDNNNIGTTANIPIDLSLPMNKKLLERKINEVPGPMTRLLTQVFIGVGRDLSWTILALRKENFFKWMVESPFLGSLFTQMSCTLIPTFAAVTVTTSPFKSQFYFSENKTDWLKLQLIYATSSWTAIPFWNGAQYLGAAFGESLGMSATNAGYFSGVFCGIMETLWQNAVVIPRMRKQPVAKLEALLNSLGGAVWQWIYQMNLPNYHKSDLADFESDLEDLWIGLQVALGVASATFFMTLLAMFIQKCCAAENVLEEKKENTIIDNDATEQKIEEEEVTYLLKKSNNNYNTLSADNDIESATSIDDPATIKKFEVIFNQMIQNKEFKNAQLSIAHRSINNHNNNFPFWNANSNNSTLKNQKQNMNQWNVGNEDHLTNKPSGPGYGF